MLGDSARRALILILGLAVLLGACSGPLPTVDRITIANPTGYDLAVEVSGGNRETWLPLTVVGTGSEVVVEQVIDQGERWTFRFKHWDDPVGEVVLTRTELEASGWRVEVPSDIQERLQQLGRPPPDE